MSALGPIDWTVFVGYLAVIFGIGLWFARRQKDSEDYFVGGRRMNWLAVGMSLFAAGFSSVSFVALPREAAYQDYHFLITILFIPLVITPILWWIFVPLYIRLGVTSVYEYLEIRFHRGLRRTGTLLFAGYAIGWMGSMLYALGLILQAVTGLNDTQMAWTIVALGLFTVAFTALGGVKAVIWTDVLQSLTLGGSILLVLFLSLGRIDGGWNTVSALAREHNKFQMFDLTPDLARRDTFYAACAFALFMYLPGYTVSQVTVQRYVATGSLARARRSLAINAVVVAATCSFFFLVGTTLFAFYHQPGAAGFPALPREDQILSYFVSTQFPRVGMVGLMLAGLFAAAMSSLDGGINSLTAVVAYDWLSGRSLSVGAGRLLSTVFGLAVIGAGLAAPYLGQHVIGIITMIAGTFLGLLLGVYLLGMFVPRANTPGAMAGLLAGVTCFLAVWTLTDVPHWWYGATTCFPSFFVGWMASYAFPPPPPATRVALVTFRNDAEPALKHE